MNANILDGHALEADFAAANRVSRKTIAKYRKEPDGLPYTLFGNRVWIPVDLAREWLRGRITKPNPTRRRGA